MIADALWLVAIVAGLLAVGCSDKWTAEDFSARGCHVKCEWCVGMDAVCVDEYDLTGGESVDKLTVPGTPDVEIDVEIKR